MGPMNTTSRKTKSGATKPMALSLPRRSTRRNRAFNAPRSSTSLASGLGATNMFVAIFRVCQVRVEGIAGSGPTYRPAAGSEYAYCANHLLNRSVSSSSWSAQNCDETTNAVLVFCGAVGRSARMSGGTLAIAALSVGP